MTLFRRFLFLTLVTLILFAIGGCGTKTSPKPDIKNEKPHFYSLSEVKAEGLSAHLSTKLQGLQSWTELRPGLEDSLKYILRRPQDAVCVNRPGLTLTWKELGDSVAELMAMLPEFDRDPRLVAERFQWLKVAPRTLLTGYYEPWLEASLERQGGYHYPLYGKPDDLEMMSLSKFHPRWKGQTLVYRMEDGKAVPYFDREAIDSEDALKGQGHEIAWAKDPVDVFFLQIQGSGRLVLPDGSVKHILYGGKNGRQYVSLGKLLINRGHVPKEEMSMQRIRQFLAANPYTAQELMNENPSYVFFKLSDEGPFGSIGSILTPRVSVAVDRTMIPLGSVVALKTALENYDTGETQQFMSLVLAQDTGGAIKGTRMDLFCGSGEEAEYLAGHLQAESEVFMLVSKRIMSKLGRK